jgi:HSP20 family protein
MFENFFSDFSPLSFTGMEERLGRFSPRVDVAETDKEIKVTAELPGMDEKDIEVKLEEGYLLLSGEKKEEKQEEAEGYYHQEMSYGSFQRRIPIDAKIEVDKVKAKFNNGILKVTMPKVPGSESKKAKKIEIKG